MCTYTYHFNLYVWVCIYTGSILYKQVHIIKAYMQICVDIFWKMHNDIYKTNYICMDTKAIRSTQAYIYIYILIFACLLVYTYTDI